MRIGTFALVVALALAALPMPAPAQVPSGPLSIHVEAVLGEPITVGDRTVFPVNGTAVLTSLLVEGESDMAGDIALGFSEQSHISFDSIYRLSGGPLTEVVTVLCTGTVDDRGTGSGRCAMSGLGSGEEGPAGPVGEGAWAGSIGIQARTLVVDMHLHVVCPRCAAR